MPNRRLLHLASALAALLLLACDDEGGRTPSPDASAPDAAPRDAAVPDAARAPDATTDAAPDAEPDAAPDADLADADLADVGPDARAPVMPDTLPTPAPADLEGADDLTAPVPPGRARAGRVDVDAERLRGPGANCPLGGYRLDNAHISLCLQGEAAFGPLTSMGGNLVDAHPADAPGSDRLGEVIIAPNVGQVSVDALGIAADGADGGPAIVRSRGVADGGRYLQAFVPGGGVPPPVELVTEYHLAPDAHHVEVLTWIFTGENNGQLQLADLVFFGDSVRGFVPGAPREGQSPRSPEWTAASAGEVAYRWSSPDAPLRTFSLPEGLLPVEPLIHDRLFLQPGDVHLIRRRLTVGHDIESVRPPPEGAVPTVLRGPPGLRVRVETPEGLAVTRARLDAAGERIVALAPGRYVARALEWAGGPVEPVELEAGVEVALSAPAPARLRVRVVDEEGTGLAAKLRLDGPGNELVFVVDEAEVELPAGRWRMITTRGWHFTADEREVDLVAGAALEVEVRLTEVIPFEGWTSGEFHQHSAPSLDSEVDPEQRVLSNLAEGVGFMVPSDHDVQFDFGALVDQMGLSDRIGAPLTGVEISPLIGHIGAYGIPYDPELTAGGAPALAIRTGPGWHRRTVAELVAAARMFGAELIQVNHPRGSSGLFDSVGFDPARPVETLDSPHWTSDIDSIEVFNGSSDFCAVLRDWYSLLEQGLRVTAIGNSDTHSESTPTGYPRNYLPTAAPTPAEVSAEEIVAAVRAGRVVVGGGAVLDFPDGPQPGETVAVEGFWRPRVRVRTPPWARVDRLVVIHGGAVVLDRSVESAPEAIVDLDEALEIPVERDGPAIVLALGDRRMRYVANDPVFALANPVWLDADGGGVAPAGPVRLELPDLGFCR